MRMIERGQREKEKGMIEALNLGTGKVQALRGEVQVLREELQATQERLKVKEDKVEGQGRHMEAVNQVRAEAQKFVEDMRKSYQQEEETTSSVVEAEIMDQMMKRDLETLKSIKARDDQWASTINDVKSDRSKIQAELNSKIQEAKAQIQKLKFQIHKEGRSSSPTRDRKDMWNIPAVESPGCAPTQGTRAKWMQHLCDWNHYKCLIQIFSPTMEGRLGTGNVAPDPWKGNDPWRNALAPQVEQKTPPRRTKVNHDPPPPGDDGDEDGGDDRRRSAGVQEMEIAGRMRQIRRDFLEWRRDPRDKPNRPSPRGGDPPHDDWGTGPTSHTDILHGHHPSGVPIVLMSLSPAKIRQSFEEWAVATGLRVSMWFGKAIDYWEDVLGKARAAHEDLLAMSPAEQAARERRLW
eukprot:1298839-Amphidinium_carterae.7